MITVSLIIETYETYLFAHFLQQTSQSREGNMYENNIINYNDDINFTLKIFTHFTCMHTLIAWRNSSKLMLPL